MSSPGSSIPCARCGGEAQGDRMPSQEYAAPRITQAAASTLAESSNPYAQAGGLRRSALAAVQGRAIDPDHPFASQPASLAGSICLA